MKFTVIIEKALPEQSGVSKSSGNPWRKRSYVGVYDDHNPRYPKRIVFDVVNDKIDQLGLAEGARYDVEIDFDAREWNGRYFLSASCWRAERLDGATPPIATAPQQTASPAANDPYAAAGLASASQPGQPAAASDDLPF